MPKKIDLKKALKIVLELAEDNCLSMDQAMGDDALIKQVQKQEDACYTVRAHIYGE